MRVKKWASVMVRFVLQTRVHINLLSLKIKCGENFEIEVLAFYLKFLETFKKICDIIKRNKIISVRKSLT